MSRRHMSVAGSFYPSSSEAIDEMITDFGGDKSETKVKARIVIAPHAGYIYSGICANKAYREIDTRGIKRIVIIGPSHRVYLQGASVSLHDTYESPYGDMKIDRAFSETLVKKYEALNFYPLAHQEHSTETQVPFIGHYFSEVSLVEIVYGEIDYHDLVPMIREVLSDEQNLVVISTDLSHFHTLDIANGHDEICIKAIEQMSLDKIEQGCEACGMIGIKAAIEVGKSIPLVTKVVEYRTSYDTNQDANRVVGYLSAIMEKV